MSEMNSGTDIRPEYPSMKWHKFLIYFSLWAGMVINGLTAVMVMTGMHYGENAALVYQVMGGMRVADIAYGLILLGMAAYTVIVRNWLAGFKRVGIRGLLSLYALSLGVELLYLVSVACVAGFDILSGMGQDLIQTTISSILGIVINRIYYSKRRHLFTN